MTTLGKATFRQVHLIHQLDIPLDSRHTVVYRVGKPLPDNQTDNQERDIVLSAPLKQDGEYDIVNDHGKNGVNDPPHKTEVGSGCLRTKVSVCFE